MIQIKCFNCKLIPTLKVTDKIITILCGCTGVVIHNNWWIEKLSKEDFIQRQEELKHEAKL